MKLVVFKQFVLNGVCVSLSLFSFEKSLITQFLLFLFAILFLITYIILPFFVIRRVTEDCPAVVLASKRKWLLVLTRNPEDLIRNTLLTLIAIAVFVYKTPESRPDIFVYVFWMFFGAFFSIKIMRYSKLYQDKYAPKSSVLSKKR